MHHIYHTNAYIIGSYNIGEANKMLVLYTRELGLVRAVAQGIRLNKSKLRYALQDFSYARIDLVRGRDIWRVTSGTSVDVFPYLRSNKDSLMFVARMNKLLERVCDGEESNPNIFDEVMQCIHILDDLHVSRDSREALELHIVLRILNNLGYIGESDTLSQFLGKNFDYEKIHSLLQDKKSIISHINRALNESQL